MGFISYSTELGLTFTSSENTWDFLLRHLYISTYNDINDIYHVSMCLHTLDIQTALLEDFWTPQIYLKHPKTPSQEIFGSLGIYITWMHIILFASCPL